MIKNRFFCLVTAFLMALCCFLYPLYNSSTYKVSALNDDSLIFFNGLNSNAHINDMAFSVNGISTYQNKKPPFESPAFVRCVAIGGANNNMRYIRFEAPSGGVVTIYSHSTTSDFLWGLYFGVGAQGESPFVTSGINSNGYTQLSFSSSGSYELYFNSSVYLYYLGIEFKTDVETPSEDYIYKGYISSAFSRFWSTTDNRTALEFYISSSDINFNNFDMSSNVILYNFSVGSVVPFSSSIFVPTLDKKQGQVSIIFDNTIDTTKSLYNIYDLGLRITDKNSVTYDIAPYGIYIRSVGKKEGYEQGYNEGYNKGWTAGVNDAGDYTFFSLIAAVIDAPITAFYGLFNFELLGVNLVNLFTGLFTAAVILLILRLVIK